jgi:hypothetical protein
MKDFKHYLSLINESETNSITFGDYKIDFTEKSILEGSIDFPNKHTAYIITTDNGKTFEVSMMKNRKLLFDTSINNADYKKDKGVWKELSLDDVRSLLIDISNRS